jgi:ribosomal protein S18 acetylase RimI-like enzyme
MYSVRIAKSADAKKIARIHVHTWRVSFRGQSSEADLDTRGVRRRETYWRERFGQARGSVFVIERDGIVGFCDFMPSRDKDADKTIGEIAALYVVSNDWRVGAGKVLCCHILAQARKQGYKAITLWILASNGNAMRFYESLGFVRDGTVKIAAAPDGSTLQEIRYRLKFDRADQGTASNTAVGA